MKIIKHIPNTITSMNLLAGVIGVIYTLNGRFDIAFYMMLASALFDFCDGLSARALKAYSDIGKELDSLADMVSFGVLPSLMLYKTMSLVSDSPICYIPLIIAVFSALRLAKFNIDERQTENFIGLATPACAMICGSFTYYISKDPSSVLAGWASTKAFIPVASVILALLLVSEIPMFSIKIKKGMKKDIVFFQRLGFIAVIAVSAISVVALQLNWSLIVLLSFTGYIILNVATSPFRRG